MISVIMLTYNRETLVSKAIESILQQTYTEFEFIIVDNGSTDASGAICDSYAARDNRVHVIHREKGSIGAGRNTGLAQATGEYITFIDDDDYALPDMLSFLISLAEDYDADIALCGSYKEVEGELLPNFVYEECLVLNSEQAVVEYLRRKRLNAAMPTKLLKRHLFDKIHFLENGKYDDISVGYRYFAEARCTVAKGAPKYCFCRHTTNNSLAAMSDNLLHPEQLEEYFAAFRERTIYISKRLPAIGDYVQYSEWSYMISMLNKIEKNRLKNCSSQAAYIREVLGNNFNIFYKSPYLIEFEKDFLELYFTDRVINKRKGINI